MAAHLREAAIELALLANENRLHRRLHVVVDAARAGALEKGEGALMRVENHLLRLAWIGANEDHPAVAQAHVGDLHDRRHAVEQDDLMAPVELIGFTRIEAERNIGGSRQRSLLIAPFARIAPHRVIAAFIAKAVQILENPDQSQPLSRWFFRVRLQQIVELFGPRSELRQRLRIASVNE